MVSPTTATATFKGLQTGKTYSVDVYIADAVGATKFDSDGGASATSLPFWKCPENVVLVDLAIVTGPTVINSLVVTKDGAIVSSNRLRLTSFLTTLATRPPLALGFPAGSNFGFNEA